MRWFIKSGKAARVGTWAFSLGRLLASALLLPVHSHSTMEPPPPPPSCTVAGGAAGGGEDPFDDIVTPPDLLQGLGDDDGCLYGAAAMGAVAKDERRLAEAQAAGDGGRVEDGLSMTYRGHNKNMVIMHRAVQWAAYFGFGFLGTKAVLRFSRCMAEFFFLCSDKLKEVL